mgnify:CR=1 FL=1
MLPSPENGGVEVGFASTTGPPFVLTLGPRPVDDIVESSAVLVLD